MNNYKVGNITFSHNQVKVIWNGKTGRMSKDQNHQFRMHIIDQHFINPDISNADIMSHILNLEVSMTIKSLNNGYRVSELMLWLLITDFDAYIEQVIKLLKMHPYVGRRFEDISDEFGEVEELIDLTNRTPLLDEEDRIYFIGMLKLVITRINRVSQAKRDFEDLLHYQASFKEKLIEEVRYFGDNLNPKIILMFCELIMLLALGTTIFRANFVFGMVPYMLGFLVIFILLKGVDLVASRRL